MEMFCGILSVMLVYTDSSLASSALFYESEQFVGLLAEQTPNDTCVNLPRRAFNRSNSLTTDSCLIIYTGENCTQFSIHLEPGSYSSLANVSHANRQHFGNAIKAFHKCAKNLDVPKVSFLQEKEILGEYSVCSCVTLPSTIDQATKMDNHGNCVILYTDTFGSPPSCSGANKTVQGGHSFLTQNLRNFTQWTNVTHAPNGSHAANGTHGPSIIRNRIAAIGPCPETLSKCTRLSARVTKFIVSSDPDVASLLFTLSSVPMAITTSIRNNGSAKVTEEYRATKSVSESTETKVVSGYFLMDSWKVESGFGVEFSEDIPTLATGIITSSLCSAYNSPENFSVDPDKNVTRKRVSTNYSVHQKIEIEPCSSYKINSSVQMVKNFPVTYKAYFIVSGVLGGRKLTTQELRKQLEDWEFLEEQDEHAIMATGQGQMSADFGLETVVNLEGTSVRNCVGAKATVQA